MDIVNPNIDKYIDSLISNRDPVFVEMETYATKISFPIVGPQVGQILMSYAKLMNATRILELGSGYGYSAIWFDKGMNEKGEIICTDFSHENELLAMKYFESTHIKSSIKYQIGNALEIMEQTEGEFDIIFNDVDKEDYPKTLLASIPKLRKGGVLITDNTLWYGSVIKEGTIGDATQGVMEYNRLAFSDTRVISILLPVRDGLTISIKL
ncbi:MAG: O-methyltransferase [Candidatus Heimdallarchaeota archaeon]|nr:O-methyltransferase [Candidatus Heimdallarchaeota archaeon]MCK4877263.1 O-methyltransferase [Candidatus Heimdallarchaeota archaeon]